MRGLGAQSCPTQHRVEVFQQRAGSLNAKDYCWLKKTRCLVKEFSAFLCLRKCESLGSLKSLLTCTSPAWGRCPGLHILCVLGAHRAERLLSQLLGGRYSLLPESLQGSPTHRGWRLQSLMTVTSFVYWYGGKYSISQDRNTPVYVILYTHLGIYVYMTVCA